MESEDVDDFFINSVVLRYDKMRLNELSERQCRTLTDMIKLHTNNNQKDKDRFLPFLVFA